MPTVFYWKGYRFYFFSLENNEPVHIHVEKAEGSAKYWMNPIKEEYSYGFSSGQRKEIRKFITENSEQIKEAWHEHFKNQ